MKTIQSHGKQSHIKWMRGTSRSKMLIGLIQLNFYRYWKMQIYLPLPLQRWCHVVFAATRAWKSSASRVQKLIHSVDINSDVLNLLAKTLFMSMVSSMCVCLDVFSLSPSISLAFWRQWLLEMSLVCASYCWQQLLLTLLLKVELIFNVT